MRVFALSIIIWIKQIFSRDIKFNDKLNVLAIEEDAFHSLNLRHVSMVLKENIENQGNCIKILKEHCPELKEIFPELKKMCNGNIDQECKDLKVNKQAQSECKKIEIMLESTISSTEDKCELFLEKCLFLQSVCSSSFRKQCNKLMVSCYKKERDKIADTALMRALRRSLYSEAECRSKIKQYCLLLSKESDELMSKCLTWTLTCERLTKTIQERYIVIKDEIQMTIGVYFQNKNKKNVKYNNIFKNKCYQLLPECYFYVENYENDQKNWNNLSELSILCNKFRNICESINVIYNPHAYFNPMEQDISLSDIIDLSYIYNQAAKNGIVVNRRLNTFNIYRLFALLIHTNINIEEKCKKALYNNCSSTEYLDKNFKEKCLSYKQNNNDVMECIILPLRLKVMCQDLDEGIRKYLGISKNNNLDVDSSWNTFPPITPNICVMLLSECFYLEETCEKTYFQKSLCDNLRLVCYYQGFLGASYSFMEDVLRGYLHNSTNLQRSSTCTTKLIEVCRESKELYTYGQLELCLLPKKTCSKLISNVQQNCEMLKKQLNSLNNYGQLTIDKCRTLESACNTLILDCPELNINCSTLYKFCNILKGILQVKYKLLSEKKNYLEKKSSCIQRLNDACDIWSENNKTFVEPCKQRVKTCEIIFSSMNNHCLQFKENLKKYNITLDTINNNIKDKECALWMSYCDMLKDNCLFDNLSIYCERLTSTCSNYYEIQFENFLNSELKGCFGNKFKCMNCLELYCNNSTQIKNIILITYCKNIKNDKADQICQKFVDNMQKRCKSFLDQLNKSFISIEKKKKIFQEIKIKAINASEKALEKNKLAIVTDVTSEINQTSYIIQIQHDKLYIEAFQAVIDTLGLQKSLIYECIKTFDYCVFKDDCFDIKIKNICQKIKILCEEMLFFKEPSSTLANVSTVIRNVTLVETLTSIFTEVITETTTDFYNKPTCTNSVIDTIYKTIIYNKSSSASIMTYTETEKTWTTQTDLISQTTIITIEISSTPLEPSEYWTTRILTPIHDLQRRQSEYSVRSSYLKPSFCVVCYRPIDALSLPFDPGCGHMGHEECFRQKAVCPKCLGPVNMIKEFHVKKSENMFQKLFTTARQKSMFFRNSTIPLEQPRVCKPLQSDFSLAQKLSDIPSHPAIFNIDFEVLTDYDTLKKNEEEVIMYVNLISQYQDTIDLPSIYSLDIAVCLDMSESMAHGNKLAIAKEITCTLLYDLQSTDRLCILTTLSDDKNKIFALHTCDNLHKNAVQNNLSGKMKEMKGVYSCYSDNGISKALDILVKNKRHGRLGHIIVISDGCEVSVSSDKINHISSQAKRHNIVIHALGVGPCPDPTHLRHLTSLGAEGGCYICVNETRKVKNFLKLCAAGSCMAKLSNIKINVAGLEGVGICDMRGDKNAYYDADGVCKHDNKLELMITNLTPLEERSFFITLNVPTVSSFSGPESFVVPTEALASELESMIKAFPANIASCKICYKHPCFPASTILRLNTKYATVKRLDNSECTEDTSSRVRNPTVLLALLRQYALEGIVHAHEMINRGRNKAASSLIDTALRKIEEVVTDGVWRLEEINELKDELQFQRLKIHSRTISVLPRRTYTCMSSPSQVRCTKISPLRTSPKVSSVHPSKELWVSPKKVNDNRVVNLHSPHKSILKDHSVNSIASNKTPKSLRNVSLARTRSQITKTTTTIEYSTNLSQLKSGKFTRRRSLDPIILRESSTYSTMTLPQSHHHHHHRKESWQTDDEAKRIWRELKKEMRTPKSPLKDSHLIQKV
ncbi:hypothetical protein PCANB_001302 [Pneumocystis canis]|nr:hypothetical protein PCANB_001302 [Pneumocystis canis]